MSDEDHVAIDPLQEARDILASIVPSESDPALNGHGPYRNPGGAPKGNQNARKHGLYSKLLPPESREDVADDLPVRTLSAEIRAVRRMLADRLAEPGAKLEDVLPALRVLAHLVNVNQKYTTVRPD